MTDRQTIVTDGTTPREVRLKADYAEEYPGIEPGVWMATSAMAEKLVAHTHARRRLSLYTRTFDPHHFEFRGGSTRRRPHTARTRSTDVR